MASRMTPILWLLCLNLAATALRAEAGSGVVLANDRIRVRAWTDGSGLLHESYMARAGGQWDQVAGEQAGSAGPTAMFGDAECAVPGSVTSVASDGSNLVEKSTIGGVRVVRTISLLAGGPWLHVTTRILPGAAMSLHRFVDRFVFHGRPDWTFAPSVGGFAPDVQYKAPLILVQSGRAALGIVPDLAALDAATLRACSHSLDLDVPGGPILAVGFAPARLAFHSVYEPDPRRVWTAGAPLENSYFVLVTASAEPGEAYREAVRLHWAKFGRPLQLAAASQQAGTPTPASAYSWLKRIHPVGPMMESDARLAGLGLWDDWRAEVWGSQTPERWLLVPLPGGATGGGVQTLRWGPGPSVYLSAWFNTLRTSFGMGLYARRTGRQDLLKQAGQTVELALGAPGLAGAFKCIAVPTGNGGKVLWAAGDGNGNGTEEGYLGYDMSWTAYWLLRWRAAGLPDRGAILPRCRALAQFFCERQADDGMLPTRFAEDGSVLGDASRTVKAETGPVALFLLELYGQDPDPRWLAAGRRGLAFLSREVVPDRQWYDFETFWSCSPRTPVLDRRSGQWPANDLALGQSVAAFLSAYRATNDRAYLVQGESLLDYLLLYQQCWTNPLIENVGGPATLLGGFTTQNSDAEWSDARQSQCGNVLLDYYRATGNAEYLERGVAALRAQFPVSPCENFAHSGYESKTGISSFHWGTGSGMAGVEIEDAFLRDAVVDVVAGCAVGVNGLNVTGCAVAGRTIRLDFSSPFRWKRPPVFVFHRCAPSGTYRIVSNGADLGTFRGDVMERGIAVPSAPAN
jgi:hypothetical protein